MSCFRCDDFIAMCEIHREFYPSSNIHPGHPRSCCGYFFQEKPFFSYQGTCFTTKETVTVAFPASPASIRIWTYVNQSASPEFSLIMRGSDAAGSAFSSVVNCRRSKSVVNLRLKVNKFRRWYMCFQQSAIIYYRVEYQSRCLE